MHDYVQDAKYYHIHWYAMNHNFSGNIISKTFFWNGKNFAMNLQGIFLNVTSIMLILEGISLKVG